MEKQDLVDLLALVTERGASDLHLTVGAPPMLRVAGVIEPVSEDAAVLSPEETRRLVIDALKEGQRARLENEWQLDFALQVGNLGRFRGNACYVTGAIEANFRLIPSAVGDLKSLGHSPAVDKWCDEQAGLILVTGASGEGKSTTLASMAQTIANRRSANIVSIVGEMRDTDTMQTAITAAETGHLVIGTMHTNDAPTAIGRIIDAFPKE